ncbi:MAG: type II toxin-antitoxin system death-on-curing family toxin, partial [Gammaproteobacteria bacterium]|nr:type II toxin-antitoxin system death-on-curing family toxin [Gammaproteobacteria bacterium]
KVEAALTMLGVASGDIDEAAFAAWLRVHLARR